MNLNVASVVLYIQVKMKQKIVVPLLVLLGHRREDLEFEYRTRRGGLIDIFINGTLRKKFPKDIKWIERYLADYKKYDLGK